MRRANSITLMTISKRNMKDPLRCHIKFLIIYLFIFETECHFVTQVRVQWGDLGHYNLYLLGSSDPPISAVK